MYIITNPLLFVPPFCVSIICLSHLRKSQTQYVITEIGVHGPSLVNKVYTLFEETVKNFEG